MQLDQQIVEQKERIEKAFADKRTSQDTTWRMVRRLHELTDNREAVQEAHSARIRGMVFESLMDRSYKWRKYGFVAYKE